MRKKMYTQIYTHSWAGVQEQLDKLKATGWQVTQVGQTSIQLEKLK